MIPRPSHGWQVILADLSLILFIVIASAFIVPPEARDRPDSSDGHARLTTEATAIWRPQSGRSLPEWLRRREADPRETVTITARYTDSGQAELVSDALNLLAEAEAAGFTPRMYVEHGTENELFATVSFVGMGPSAVQKDGT